MSAPETLVDRATPATAPVAEIRRLTIGFGRAAPVVRGVSLSVGAGECVALVGRSGSGKSVTARSLLGLTGRGARVEAEVLRIAGQDVRRFGERRWRGVRGSGVGLVAQDALESLDPLRRVGREVAEGLAARGEPVPRDEREALVHAALRRAGIPDPEVRARQYPHELSGGLRQRALIAAALAGEPALLVADEPTTALDVVVQRQILALLADIRDGGVGLLLVSHDLAVVSTLADRVLVMADGEIVESGAPETVLTDPEHPATCALVSDSVGRRPQGRTLPQAPPVLEVRDVSRSFGTRRAVDGVSLALAPGESVGIVGESGSGKSTLARIALGLLEPDSGSVLLEGEQWAGYPERERRPRRSRIQLIAQNPLGAFDPRLRVGAIVAEGLRGGSDVEALLKQVGLAPELAGRRPHELSGGQRQRVAIARALATEPDVLVCDEPVSALDVSVQAQVLDLLTRLRDERGLALLMITHDLGVVAGICDRVVIMRDGRVVEHGPTVEVFEAPQHEYTRLLLEARPSVGRGRSRRR